VVVGSCCRAGRARLAPPAYVGVGEHRASELGQVVRTLHPFLIPCTSALELVWCTHARAWLGNDVSCHN
jgi:hypothetical protein